jgi:PAB1-binding protein PBP1
MELMQEFVRDFAKQSKADNEQIIQDAVTRILATIISAMGQQAGGYVAVPAMMQMQGMNVMPAPSVTPAEPTEPVKEMVEELQDNNLELSDKPLDDGALASLSAMFGDDEED